MRSELSWHLMCSIKVSLTFLHSSKQTSPQEVKLSGLSLLVTLQPPSEFLLNSEGHPTRSNYQSLHPGNILCPFTTPSTAIRRNLVCLRVQTFSVSWLVCVIMFRMFVWRGNYLDSKFISWIHGMFVILEVYATLPLDLRDQLVPVWLNTSNLKSASVRYLGLLS